MTNSVIPSYTDFTEGKKLTKKQHARRMQQYEEMYGKVNMAGELVQKKEVAEEDLAPKSGQCIECRNGGFYLSVEDHELTRTCMKCGRKDTI